MWAQVSAHVGVLCMILCLFIHSISAQNQYPYHIGDVTIKAFKPRGFEASIPHEVHILNFLFQGNVNLPIKPNEAGTISGEVTQVKDGRWTVEDPNIELKVGDVIFYYIRVVAHRNAFTKNNLYHMVTALEDRSGTDTPATECKPTQTRVRGGTACSGQVIFEEAFYYLQDDVWQIEQFLPVYAPNFPFVSYQHLTSDPTVSLDKGVLHIMPKLQQTLPGFTEQLINTGSLNLFIGCTSSGEACIKQAEGADILPPIVSGRITTKNSFAFTYGTVTVRAKLPQGDWLYPEILLEPFQQKYGTLHYSSGVIQIASARGNRVLTSGDTDYSNKVLYGGPIMDLQCHDTLINKKMHNNSRWGDGYHEYSVRWAPDRITLSVDGVEWARVEPTASGLRGHFPAQCTQLPRTLLKHGSKMAPFDDHFYITLGLGAGSITEFPDGVMTVNGRPKPWTNPSRKALLKFWQDKDGWLDTWNQPQMLVDSIKVIAL